MSQYPPPPTYGAYDQPPPPGFGYPPGNQGPYYPQQPGYPQPPYQPGVNPAVCQPGPGGYYPGQPQPQTIEKSKRRFSMQTKAEKDLFEKEMNDFSSEAEKLRDFPVAGKPVLVGQVYDKEPTAPVLEHRKSEKEPTAPVLKSETYQKKPSAPEMEIANYQAQPIAVVYQPKKFEYDPIRSNVYYTDYQTSVNASKKDSDDCGCSQQDCMDCLHCCECLCYCLLCILEIAKITN